MFATGEVTHDGAAKATSWNLRTERVCEPFDLYLWYARWKVHGYARRCAPTYLHSQLTYSSIGVRLSCSSSSDSTALLVDERVVVARGVVVLVLVLVQVDLRHVDAERDEEVGELRAAHDDGRDLLLVADEQHARAAALLDQELEERLDDAAVQVAELVDDDQVSAARSSASRSLVMRPSGVMRIRTLPSSSSPSPASSASACVDMPRS